jgi:predicted nucleotidyltransferase
MKGRDTKAPADLRRFIERRREEILRIARRHGARNVRLFGSLARDEPSEGSDVDLLVEMEPGRSLLDHTALIQDLEELVGRPVDVVSEKALHWYVRDRVLREAVPL